MLKTLRNSSASGEKDGVSMMEGIFISYRREESAGHAGRMYDRLRERFGRERVFMDVSAIEPGIDFGEAIERAVSSCAVLLVVIGRRWLECSDAAGRRRLDDPKDFIRLEVSAALRRTIRVIPVLVQDAAMPEESDLPDDLKLLVRRNAIEINDTHWDSDLSQLVETLERILAGGAEPSGTAGSAVRKEGRSKKNRLTWIIGSITAVVVALTWLLTGSDSLRDAFLKPFRGGGAEMTNTTGGTSTTASDRGPEAPATATVPKVLGMEEQEAVERIRGAGFQPRVERLRNSVDPPGTVFHQEPGPDTPLEPGAKIVLHVAMAPERTEASSPVIVPILTGQPLERAAALLRKAGLVVGEVNERATREAAAGTVIDQIPRAGTKLAKGKRVALVVAARPLEQELVTVPNVLRQPLERAVHMLTEAGLNPGAETQRPTDLARPGTVLGQRLKGGSQARPGARVDLIVAARPAEPVAVSVPSVVGEHVDKAVELLRNSGLNPGKIERRESLTHRPETVLRQRPGAGEKVRPGGTVDLLINVQGR
jgi:beta-lactam-binding protein with PASTA domain